MIYDSFSLDNGIIVYNPEIGCGMTDIVDTRRGTYLIKPCREAPRTKFSIAP